MITESTNNVILLDANAYPINTMFKEKWYIVPEYQRAYVWDKEKIEELLSDINFSLNNGNPEYFIGSIILSKTTTKTYEEYEVIDGQQRLTTMLLIFAVLRDVSTDNDVIEACNTYIQVNGNSVMGTPSRVRILVKTRDDVEEFIKNNILTKNGTNDLESFKKIAANRKVSKSVSNMANAVIYIHNFLKTEISDLNTFASYLAQKTKMVSIDTNDRENAFRIFSILNDRGMHLGSSDILKALNIGAIQENSALYVKKWDALDSKYGKEFDRFLSFIRTILVKKNITKSLHKEFEEYIYGNEILQPGVSTINFLERYNDIYSILIEKTDNTLGNDISNLIEIMNIGFPSKDWIPPILYFYDKFGAENLLVFLKKVNSKFFCDWILGLHQMARIDNMNKILKGIDIAYKEKDVNLLLNHNTLFQSNLKEVREQLNLDIYRKKYLKYVLLYFEYLLSDNSVSLSNYSKISTEHILPQNPSENSEWTQSFNEDDMSEYCDKLGNLVLLNSTKNTKLSNLEFIDKRDKYLLEKTDVFVSTKIYLTNKNNWTKDDIIERQTKMIDQIIGSL